MAVIKYRNSDGNLQLLNIPIVQVAELPEAKEELSNKILQYTGEDTENYKNGYFYKCILENESYIWKSVKVQSGGGGEGGTSDYEELDNKPKIGGVTLIGDKSLTDLGIDLSTKVDIEQGTEAAGKILKVNNEGNLELAEDAGGSTVTVSEEGPATEEEKAKFITIDEKTWELAGSSSAEQVQSDWTEEDEESKAFIQNKPLDLVHINNDITEIQVLIK